MDKDFNPDLTRAPQAGKELLEATRPFAKESVARSWWCVLSTLALLGATLTGAALAEWWPVRLGASFFGGLLMVRVFILYHDFMHRALLRRSWLANIVFSVIGLIWLAPPRYWRYSHNYHHGNVGKPIRPDKGPTLLVTSDLGSFPLMSTETWRVTPFWQRLKYRITRHPVTLLCAYVTVFLFSLCLIPMFQEPRRYFDGALAVLAHGALLAGIWVLAGMDVAFFSFGLPFAIAAAAGAYLFFAQHNYEGMRVLNPDEWTFFLGATESSSYMKLSALLHWFTGNIGYHHVHHLNPAIPFYRLPEALAAIPELQEAEETSLHLGSIVTCLRLHLWDHEQDRLVRYRDAKKSA